MSTENENLEEQNAEINPDLRFDYSEETVIKPIDPNPSKITGQYQIVDSEGNVTPITYTADENGFHPASPNLPTPPSE